MANPTKVFYRLPTTYEDGQPIALDAIERIDLGIGTTAGAYPLVAPDITFEPDGDGVSFEPLAAFGLLAPGNYFVAGKTVTKLGRESEWSEAFAFVIEAPKPNPPTALSVA